MGLVQVRELDDGMLQSAVTVQRLERQRANVNTTLDTLKVQAAPVQRT